MATGKVIIINKLSEIGTILSGEILYRFYMKNVIGDVNIYDDVTFELSVNDSEVMAVNVRKLKT